MRIHAEPDPQPWFGPFADLRDQRTPGGLGAKALQRRIICPRVNDGGAWPGVWEEGGHGVELHGGVLTVLGGAGIHLHQQAGAWDPAHQVKLNTKQSVSDPKY